MTGNDFLRILAVDLGDERTGLAFSDLSGTLAGETLVIEEWDENRLCDKINALLPARGVGAAVVGLPLNMDGSRGPRAEKAERFAALLGERTGLPVSLWDERRTTVEAHRILAESGKNAKKRKKTVDAVAAALILEGFLRTVSR